MMKLILSLTLIWTLSSTAEALQCWQGTGDTKELRPCNSTQLCATFAPQGYVNGNQVTVSSCVPPHPNIKGKHKFSYNLGFMAASLHMCNTDGCNREDIPYLNDLKKNNLQCFTCDDPSSAECNKTVQCRGDEDRCVSGTVEDNKGAKGYTFGCVSGDLCEHLSDLKHLLDDVKFTQPPKCCGNSFCNSSWSVKLNVMTLLFGLISLICY